MQLSGNSNNLDLFSDARKWCGIELTDTTTLPLAEFVLSANFGLDRVISLIMKADGKWQFDDTNQTDALISTADLVANQQDYAIAISFLKIKKLRIKDKQGNFITLRPIDRRQAPDSLLRRDAGDPRFYDKLGNSLYLLPKPDYSSTGGLEIQTQRGASYFAVDDTTKQPGFATDFHRLISLYGALDYCEQNDLERRANKIRAKIGTPPDPSMNLTGSGMEKELVDHYSRRDTDQKISLVPQREDYGQRYLESDTYGGRHHPDRF